MSNQFNIDLNELYKKCDHLTGQRAYEFVHELARKCVPPVAINALCREADIARQTVFRWKILKKSIPDANTLIKLAKAAKKLGANV